MLVRTVIIFIFIAFFIGLAQTTGPIINMLLMMSMDYKAKVSISLTYIFLAGGSIATIWKNAVRKNPKTGKSNVKLDLILVTLPCLASGALFGSVFKNFFSQIMITFLFIFLFLYLIYDLCKTIRQKKQDPKQEIKAEVFIQLQEMNNPMQQSLIKQNQVPMIDQSKTYIQYSSRPSTRNKVLHTVILSVSYYVFTVLTYMIRGGPRTKSIIGLNACGATGWAILFGHLFISICASVFTVNRIIEETKGLTVQQIQKYSVQVTHKNVWYFLFAGFLAGFFSALLAIGATLIVVPVWLKMGVDKNFAGNSTATLILVSSAITFSVAYFNHVFDQIPYYVLIFYLVFSFVCSAIFRDILATLTAKYKLEQLVIVLLLAVVIITLLALIPFQISRLLKDYKRIVELGQLC